MVLLLILIAMVGYSQDTRKNELRTLIDTAISVISNEQHKFYHVESSEDYSKDIVVYVIDENNNQVNLDNVKTKLRLKSIDIFDKKNRELLKKGLNVWKVYPNLKGDTITILL